MGMCAVVMYANNVYAGRVADAVRSLLTSEQIFVLVATVNNKNIVY